jgi:lysophospholipase L1-like esterase
MLKFLTLSIWFICFLHADAPYTHPFYQKQLQEVKQMKAQKIIFLGDSLTHRHDWSNFKASNMGIDGDTTDGVLKRLHLTSHADTIVLMIGANDILQRTSISKIQKNYSKLLSSFKKTQKVYIISVLPVVDDKQTKNINQDIRILNQWLKDEVKKHDMTFINFYQSFLQVNGLNHSLTTDGVHLTKKGYILWEKLLRNYLKS